MNSTPFAVSPVLGLLIAMCGLVVSASGSLGDDPLRQVRPVPDAVRQAFRLDLFYKKHIDLDGFPILGSERVSDAAMIEAADIVEHMLADRDDIRKALIKNKVRLAVMSSQERTTDVPEHSDLTPKEYWDRRARGLGATRQRPAVSCAEENLLCRPGDRYAKENILVHEFSHAMHEMGLASIDPKFDSRLRRVFAAAKEKGLWKDTYAMSNHKEYWAEGVQSYFDTNAPPDREHNGVDTREMLAEYDPALLELIDEVFKQSKWRYERYDKRHGGKIEAPRTEDEVAKLVARVREAGPQGAGSAEARAARDALARRGPEAIPGLLDGMDTPDTVAANWLRTAFDEVVTRAMRQNAAAISLDALRKFVLDAKRQGRVRRLALDVLTKLEPAAPDTIIPGLLSDPEFRRDAVAVWISNGEVFAEANDPQGAASAYSKAFDAARDADQVRTAAAKLKSLGRDVDLVEHMGFLIDWFVVGPFDDPDFKAFNTVYGPEREVAEPRGLRLDSTYEGQSGRVAWKRHRTPDEFGTVDLVKAVAAVDDAAAFAFTAVISPDARDVQLRVGADDNLQMWLNGKKVFGKDEWQNGTRLDRFIVPVQLRAGRNELLVKVCQGPKYADPGMSNLWSMQLRLCDSDGKGIALASGLSAPSSNAKE